MASNRDINDLSRFYDTSEDGRTHKQIMWEEGIYKNGSLRQKWAYSFGKNDLYKFGKKISACLCLMLLWLVISITVPFGILKGILQLLSVLAVNAASIWLYRQTCQDKSFTRLNAAYLIFCAVFTLVFYRFMDTFFGSVAHGLFLSFYFGIYTISPFIANALRICIALTALYYILRYNFKGNFFETAHCTAAIISVLTGIIFKTCMAEYTTAYYVCLVIVLLTLISGFILYLKTKNKFLRNIAITFSIISLMEILGSNAVVTGVMERYIEKGIF